jgi:hypothetical protein
MWGLGDDVTLEFVNIPSYFREENNLLHWFRMDTASVPLLEEEEGLREAEDLDEATVSESWT